MTLTARDRILVTGAGGFVGRKLMAALQQLENGPEVLPFGRPDGAVDLRDRAAVQREVEEVQPSYVVHLAGIAAVTAAGASPDAAWDVNLGGTLTLMRALAEHAGGARLLHISTGEVYGFSFNDGPADEHTLPRPANVYAASKAAADLAVQQQTYEGLDALVLRPFNHIGRGQSNLFAVPSFAAQIAAIERGVQAPIMRVGSLDEERDFLSVDDVVAAYLGALDDFENLRGGLVYNVASGVATRIGDILERLLDMSRVPIQIEIDPARLRRNPVRRVVGLADKLRHALGWKPRGDLSQVLEAVLNEHRCQYDQAP